MNGTSPGSIGQEPSRQPDGTRAVLERISSDDDRHTNGARVLSPRSGVAALAALLDAVDETVLPRRFELTLGDTATLELHVSNRQILQVLGGSFVPASKVRHVELIPGTASQAVFETMLMTFCEGDGPLALRVTRLQSPDIPIFGLSASTLRTTYAASLANVTGKDFFHSIRPVLLCWNDGTDEDGDQTLLDELDDFFERVDTDLFEAPYLGLTQHAHRAGIFVGVAKLREMCLSFMLDRSQLNIVTRAFHSDLAQ